MFHGMPEKREGNTGIKCLIDKRGEYKHVKNLQKSFWRALLSQNEGKAVQTNFL